ncbi:MAG: winged helix-turn-helix domain-containing protein [Acidimicrobiales bacterium]
MYHDTAPESAELIDPSERRAIAFGVEVVRLCWPESAVERDDLAASGTPRILLIKADGAPPPTWDPLEDWVRLPIDRVEVRARELVLRDRALRGLPILLNEDGLLRRGRMWRAVPPVELALLEPLVNDAGKIVTRAELLAHVRPDQATDLARVLDTAMQRVRRRVRPLGITIHTVRAVGYLLEVGEPPL